MLKIGRYKKNKKLGGNTFNPINIEKAKEEADEITRTTDALSKKVNRLMGGEIKNPLSDSDIKNLLENKTNIYLYEDLANVDDIVDILKPYGNCILLYQNSEHEGHWVCLNIRNTKSRGNIIEFFDSYGGAPDSQLKYCKYVKEPYLTQLLEKSQYDVSWNPYKLQSQRKDVNTCGRWCILRSLMSDIPLSEFVELFKDNKKKPDYYATLLTTLLTN